MSDEKRGSNPSKSGRKRTSTKTKRSENLPPPEAEFSEEPPAEATPASESPRSRFNAKEAEPKPHEELESEEDEERERERVRSREPQRSNAGPSQAAPRQNPEPRDGQASAKDGQPQRLGDEYSIQTYFDRSSRQFVAFTVEFPDLKVASGTRESAASHLSGKLEQHLQNLKRRGPLPEPVQSRRYPERLDVRVSQNLARKLDLMSRNEKVSLEQLVVELLTAATERKAEPPPRRDAPRPQQPQQPQSGNQRHHGHRRGGQSRNYHETMDNRENFMEYVRNLEKGNWRKK